ncbi:hypothetical protein [Thalassovita sp.]|uniref:hypothetical protein n=1 Tax=Thalassovita sp. TaxID=1979401 RepID=UPI0029DE8C7A|nr:hypothetical protein [Thalassovita sp.]
MTARRVGWGLLTLLTVAVYAALLWLGNLHLYVGPDRLPPFDVRLLGYSLAEAQAYLTELHPVQRNIYAGPIRLLDSLFPLLFAVWIWVTLWALGAWRVALIAPIYLGLDLGENVLVARILEAGAEGVTADMVGWASLLTVAKFAAVGLALIALGHAGLRRWGKL